MGQEHHDSVMEMQQNLKRGSVGPSPAQGQLQLHGKKKSFKTKKTQTAVMFKKAGQSEHTLQKLCCPSEVYKPAAAAEKQLSPGVPLSTCLCKGHAAEPGIKRCLHELPKWFRVPFFQSTLCSLDAVFQKKLSRKIVSKKSLSKDACSLDIS